jgi:hypothetical protein
MEKNVTFNIIYIHILSQFSTTLEKDFEKGFKSAEIMTS